jgi:hypothetical protein
MGKSSFLEEKIVGVPLEHEPGTKVEVLCRGNGISKTAL